MNADVIDHFAQKAARLIPSHPTGRRRVRDAIRRALRKEGMQWTAYSLDQIVPEVRRILKQKEPKKKPKKEIKRELPPPCEDDRDCFVCGSSGDSHKICPRCHELYGR